jgi:prepilin-type processing-associated H-X9-DG protein
MLVAFIAAGLLAASIHYFCRWLARSLGIRASNTLTTPVVNEQTQHVVQQWPARWTVLNVILFVNLFVAGISMIGITHQTAWLATSTDSWLDGGDGRAYRRVSSQNTLRHLALASIPGDESGSGYPSGCTTDGRGRVLHGWLTQLLPALEMMSIYREIDLDSPWNSARNASAFQQDVEPFRNPGIQAPVHDVDGFAVAHYSANVHVLGGDRRALPSDFRDGISKTLLYGEVAGEFPAWGSPNNWRDPQRGLNMSPGGFGSVWNGGVVNFAFADGHVQAISDDIDPQVLKALSTPSGGESIED